MNFKRIQWIFLIAFLAIDIFLLVSFTSNTKFETTTDRSSNNETATLREMKDDSITVGHLSNKSATGYYISSSDNDQLQKYTGQLKNQDDHYSNGSITSTFSRPVMISKQNPDSSIQKKILNDNGRVIFGSRYTYNADLSKEEENTIVYTQKGPDHSILSSDGQIRFSVANGNQVTGYTQTYLNKVTPLREKETTISQKKAVIWLYQHNEIANNSKVKWTQLGYTKFLTLKGHNVYIPTWQIGIQTKGADGVQVKRINAFTGTLIKTDSNISGENSSQ